MLLVEEKVSPTRASWIGEFCGENGARLKKSLSRAFLSYQDADDLCQEICVRLLRMGDETPIQNPKALIYTIAANIACDWREAARNRYPHSTADLDLLVSDEGEPCEQILMENEVRQVEAVLSAIPELWRAVLVMHRVERFTRQEIAMELGVSVGTVKKYLTKALGHVSLELQRRAER